MLRLGAQQWELHRWGECKECQPLAGLRDRFSARQWLQQFRGNLLYMGALRQLLSKESSASCSLDRTTDDEILDYAAELLASGIWHVHAPETVGRTHAQSPGSNTGPAKSAGGAGAPEKSYQPSETRQAALLSESRTETPLRRAAASTAPTLSWIEIQLENADGKPVSGVEYEIKLPDGSIKSGTLNAKGLARHDKIVAGQCQVRFPKLDAGEWRRA